MKNTHCKSIPRRVVIELQIVRAVRTPVYASHTHSTPLIVGHVLVGADHEGVRGLCQWTGRLEPKFEQVLMLKAIKEFGQKMATLLHK